MDETALGDRVRAMLASAEVQMQAQVAAGVPMHDAQQAVTFKFNQECQQLCLKALEERDLALIHYAKKGPAALHVLQRAGALVPPWLLTRPPGRPLQQQLEELADVLDGSREQREYEMRARVVRTATEAKYNQLRPTPESMYDPDISHVIRPEDAIRLRDAPGVEGVLVLDPDPALLPSTMLFEAIRELRSLVDIRTQASINPCNRGSYHGFLPLGQSEAARQGLGPATCLLLRRFGALPALVSRAGWHRRLAMPPAVQLGFYPSDTGAKYSPHLDRNPGEVGNRREITFLIYLNIDWDAKRWGGHLRLHPDDDKAPRVDVEPIGGRIVVFRSGTQVHEVMPCKGRDRLALTLWCEYE